MRVRIWSLLVGGAILSWFAQAQFGIINPRGVIKGLVIPLYADSTHPNQRLGTLRVEKLFLDHETKGFFKIGALPLVAAEDVRFEILSNGAATESLQQALESLERLHKGFPVEFRRVSISFSDEASPRLEAGRARVGGAGRWNFSKGVVLRVAPVPLGPVSVEQASLQLADEHRGEIFWETGGKRMSANLFEDVIGGRQKTNPVEKVEKTNEN